MHVPKRLAALVSAVGLGVALSPPSSASITGPYTADADTVILYHFDESGGGSDPGNPIVNYGTLGTNFNLVSTGGPDGRDNASAGGYGATAYAGFGRAFDVYESGDGSYYSANPGLPYKGGANTAVPQTTGDYQGPNGEFTFEAIVRIPNTTSEQQIICRDGSGTRGPSFYVSAGAVKLYNGATVVSANIPTEGDNAFAANEWFHVAATYDGNAGAANNTKLYWTRVDPANTEANLIGTGTLGADANDVDHNLYIGSQARTPYRFEPQFVDEVRVSKVARSADEFIFRLGPVFGLLDDGGAAIPDGGVYDLGFVPENRDVACTFTITNSGEEAVELADPAVSIGGDAEFTISANVTGANTTVAPGGTTTFTIRFDGSAGSYRATVTNTFADAGTFTFSLTARALAVGAEMAVYGRGLAITNGDTTPVSVDGTDFGRGVIPAVVDHVFVISNLASATADLILTDGFGSATVRGDPDFSISTPVASTNLAPGESTTFTVHYEPIGIGTRSATVNIASGDFNQTPFTFRVSAVSSLAKADRYAMEIAFTNFVGRGTLTNFPALVTLDERRSGFSYAACVDPGGYDLRFWSNRPFAGPELNYEIERWETNGTSCIWVQIPEFRNNVSIWATCGDSAHASRQAYTTNGAVWGGGYQAVYHMSESSGTRYDSTSHDHDGTPVGDAAGAVGAIGNGNEFDGAGGMVALPNDFGLFNGLSNVTVQFWFNADAVGTTDDWHYSPCLFNARDENGWLVTFGDSSPGNSIGTRVNQGGWATPSTVGALQPGQWYLYAVTYAPNGTDNWKSYSNGVLASQGSLTGTISTETGVGSGFGGSSNGTDRWYDGRMDELTISHVTRSANWVWACWMNQGANHDAFARYSPLMAWKSGTIVILR